MSTPDGELRGRAGPDRRRAALLATAATLAALAATAVVLADDARWLRLGIVAALWAAVVAGILVARQARGTAGAQEAAKDAAVDLAAARDEADEKLAALRRDHDLRLAREAAAREESEQAAEKAREDAASLREELERLRADSDSDAVTLQSVGLPVAPPPAPAMATPPVAPRPRGPRLRVVGDSGPLPAGPATPVPPPAPLRPAPPGAPSPRSGGAANGRRTVTSDRPAAAAGPVPPPPPRPDVVPAPGDPSVLATGSFVDQYVRAAGYETPAGPPADRPAEPVPERPGRRAASGESSGTGGRTVAELLAAHAAAGGTGRRRRRDP